MVEGNKSDAKNIIAALAAVEINDAEQEEKMNEVGGGASSGGRAKRLSASVTLSTAQLQHIMNREDARCSTLSDNDRNQLRQSMRAVEALRHLPGMDNHNLPNNQNSNNNNASSGPKGRSKFRQSMGLLGSMCNSVMEEIGEEDSSEEEDDEKEEEEEEKAPDNIDENKLSADDCAKKIALTLMTDTRTKHVKTRLRNMGNMARTSHTAQGTLNLSKSILRRDSVFNIVMQKDIDVEDISYVRKPKLSKLAQLVMTKKFHRYSKRFLNSQRDRTLIYPTLKQPKEKTQDNKFDHCNIDEENKGTELVQTRDRHRFIITADTQFGILMDGFAMDEPSWKYEVELSKMCVEKINAMKGNERPLYVCVCGDLVDTESSFSTAMASWKKVFNDWERHLVFEQQCKDWKEVWSLLDEDIALVCLCGNHDVGNRPTQASIEKWSSYFGDDYVAFWVNGTYNIGLNNCLFSNPTGAPELFDEQLEWLKGRLKYAHENNAKQIFVHSHFPWFITQEDEEDEDMDSASFAPDGWGPKGTKFSDFYFNVPVETRKIALDLFKEYNVTACFSGHFHQNVISQTSWGMPMIITGPLSMTLKSTIQHRFGHDPKLQANGFRIVDCEPAKKRFQHQFIPLDSDYIDSTYYCKPVDSAGHLTTTTTKEESERESEREDPATSSSVEQPDDEPAQKSHSFVKALI